MIFILIFLSFSLPYSSSEDWTIHVYTGTERFAGTDATVLIKMFNTIHGYTNEYELTHENWLIGDALFPFKNLFESGEHDRFRISTPPLKFVERIHVRLIHLTIIRSDWFLDRIIVQRNRDSKTFIFPCHCWLRGEQPYAIISVSSDLYPKDKHSIFKDKPIIVLIVLICLVLVMCLIYCFHGYCPCHRYSRITFTQREFPILDQSYCSLLRPTAPPAYIPDNFISLASSQQVLPSSSSNNNHQPLQRLVITPSSDEPPAYRDLFPD